MFGIGTTQEYGNYWFLFIYVFFMRFKLNILDCVALLQAGKGGELTHDETTIISGALDLTEKVQSSSIC